MQLNKSNGATSELLDPASELWATAIDETVTLHPIPLDLQPNRYIREKWKDKSYGTTTSAKVSTLTNGDTLFLRLKWPNDNKPDTEFADAAAVVTGNGSAETLGTQNEAVNLWYWADDRDKGLNITCNGPGVFRKNAEASVEVSATHSDGSWSVVLAGPLSEVVNDQIGFAFWNGSNDERAGLAAVSGWLSLEQE